MAKKRKNRAKAATDKDQLSEGTSSLISWMFSVLGWQPGSVPVEWIERLPHPSFAAFVVEEMLGKNSALWGFPSRPKAILDDEPEIHGIEWDAAVQRLCDLKAKLHTEPRHLLLKSFWSRWQCLGDVMSWQDSCMITEWDWPSMPLQIETGAATLNAYLGGDIDFFRDIVRMMENEAGENRTSNWIKGIAVIQIAFDLFKSETGNPSKEQVQQTAEKSGIQVADWSSMFKDCCLDFLKYETEPRGRRKKK
ncbi:MAG: hypothetical protein NTX35_08610 [Verrucomicrobia bacterium]|nr:hypothetical protein [Verrucomicrobiota bacterium]